MVDIASHFHVFYTSLRIYLKENEQNDKFVALCEWRSDYKYGPSAYWFMHNILVVAMVPNSSLNVHYIVCVRTAKGRELRC